jgi:hypothetical protein
LANWRGAIEFVADTWNGTVDRDSSVYFGPTSAIIEVDAPDVLVANQETLRVKVSASGEDDSIVVRLRHHGGEAVRREFDYRGEDWTELEWTGTLPDGDYQLDVWLKNGSEHSALTSSFTALSKV